MLRGMTGAATYQISRVAGSGELARRRGGCPGPVARSGAAVVGVLLVRRHHPEAAEIHLMAVHPSWHRRGVGRALVETVGADLGADGCRLLQVKTLGPTDPDEGYARTRAVYRAVGFLPLEETSDLWQGSPCLIMVRCLPGSA